MLIRKQRNSQGSILAMTVGLSIIIVLVGVGVLVLMKIFGGSRELENATDSGSLNVAKQAVQSPTVTLSGDMETSNFSGLADANGNIRLLTYNKIFGQLLLVTANAQAENTPQALKNATALASAVYSPSGSLSQRLADRLNLWDNAAGSFQNTALPNSTRMLSDSTINPVGSQFQIAYTDRGGATNIYLDSSILPTGAKLPDSVFSNAKSQSTGLAYVKGYTDIGLADGSLGQLPFIAGVTVNPTQQPHLISQSTFDSSISYPSQTGTLPPNAFQSVANVQANVGNGLRNISCSEVGALTDFPACIPHGYIQIANGASVTMNGLPLPSNNSIFNNQLFTGIFIANNGVFSTNESQILAWAAYNNGGQVGTAPSTDGMFNSSGAPVNGQQNGITGLGGNGYPIMADYTNVQGPNANPAATAMLPAFQTAYPAQTTESSTGANLTAVEDLKAQVMSGYVTTSSSPQPGAFTPSAVPTTGMRVFNHNQAYPVGSGQSPQISQAGNIAQLCAQADPNGDPSVICNQIKQRMREICPSVPNEQLNALLGLDSTGTKAVPNSGQSIDLGQSFYIYCQNDNFVMTPTAPPWVTAPQTADGAPQIDCASFSTIGSTVNPVGESGFNQTLFAGQPDPSTNYVGTDQAAWQPSTGYYNLLGQLSFSEIVSVVSVPVELTPGGSGGSTAAPATAAPATAAPATVSSVTAQLQSAFPGMNSDDLNYSVSTASKVLSGSGISGCSTNADLLPVSAICACVAQQLEADKSLSKSPAAVAGAALAAYQASHLSSSVQVTSLSINMITINSGGYIYCSMVIGLSDGCSLGQFDMSN